MRTRSEVVGIARHSRGWSTGRAEALIRFSDGVDVDTSGPLRVLRLRDGLYVVGEGFLIPVDDRAEAEGTIAEMMAKQNG